MKGSSSVCAKALTRAAPFRYYRSTEVILRGNPLTLDQHFPITRFPYRLRVDVTWTASSLVEESTRSLLPLVLCYLARESKFTQRPTWSNALFTQRRSYVRNSRIGLLLRLRSYLQLTTRKTLVPRRSRLLEFAFPRIVRLYDPRGLVRPTLLRADYENPP